MTLEELLAHAEITDLVHARLHCLDTKDWDRYGGFHTRDVVSRTWGDFPDDSAAAAVVGRDALVAAVRTALGGPVPVTTVHRVQLADLRVTSSTTAEGTWSMEDRLWWEHADGLEHLHGWGHHQETYRLEDTWLVASRTLQRTRVERTPGYVDYLETSV
ncbi:nuclear transport factor 2 family protein [Nocardioides ochotonae]|uniref:nuclear transport factor 2 family protein n=1 Tax=Nocardioides ochotonae TaxID=2685869 RepID=UPI00140B8EA9|nr:nuclear transport factor 2 family protein [Nocardioides ochotonae]